MDKTNQNSKLRTFKRYLPETIGAIFLLTIVAGTLAYAGYNETLLKWQVLKNESDLRAKSGIYDAKLNYLNGKLGEIIGQSSELSAVVQGEKDKNNVILEQVSKVTDTASTLDKLSKTDPQLLQKYSKVFFLNENYVPAKLSQIPVEYTFNKKAKNEILTNVSPFLTRMFNDAISSGVHIQVVSSYRSFNTQAALKNKYKIIYGYGSANSFSADQGYSEHQLGTTLDFTTATLGASYDDFDKTPEYTWLVDNAYKYGFVISYPKDNKFYIYEPWHWRFVGVDLATKLHREGKYFYDLDQRLINDYLSVLFN